MKRILESVLLSGLAVFSLSSFYFIGESPQDPPRGKKTEKHVKMVKVDDSGKKMELDTVIYGDQVFVWQGDTIGGGKELKWITRDDFKMDSVHRFDYKIEGDGNKRIMVIKSGKGDEHIVMAPLNSPLWREGENSLANQYARNRGQPVEQTIAQYLAQIPMGRSCEYDDVASTTKKYGKMAQKKLLLSVNR